MPYLKNAIENPTNCKSLYNEAEKFIQLVTTHILSKLSLYDVTILKVFMKDNPDYEPLLLQLRGQQKDNEDLMKSILGEEAAELLKKIKP